MPRSSKSYTFQVPSLHDSTPLACTLHHPISLHSPCRIALLAHPYAPLGGSSSDPVLTLATQSLLNKHYVVCLFDFRGAGGSGGTSSWTAKAEREDLVTLVGFCIAYLSALSRRAGGHDAKAEGSEPELLDMVLGGYSYGSLIVRSLPGVENIVHRFSTAEAGSGEARIIAQAQASAVEFSQSLAIRIRILTFQLPRIRPSYLLISPLLPPISTLLTLRFSSIFIEDTEFALVNNKALAIFGDRDAFTSSSRLVKWAKRLEGGEDPRFTYKEIEGASHFWNEDGVGWKLQDSIALWLEASHT